MDAEDVFGFLVFAILSLPFIYLLVKFIQWAIEH